MRYRLSPRWAEQDDVIIEAATFGEAQNTADAMARRDQASRGYLRPGGQMVPQPIQDEQHCNWCGEPIGDEGTGVISRINDGSLPKGTTIEVHAEPCYVEAIATGVWQPA